MEKAEKLILTSSPHVHSGNSVEKIMWTVFFALVPATLVGVWAFGFMAVKVILLTTLAAVGFEVLIQKLMKKPITVKDGSAALTGLLLALNMPPSSPWWLCLAGSFIAVFIAKQVFGGLGYNLYNPALVARVFLLIAFPVQMTMWAVPMDYQEIKTAQGRFLEQSAVINTIDGKMVDAKTEISPNQVDVITSASPLGILKEKGAKAVANLNLLDFFTGFKESGSLGEISALFLLLGGLFLIFRGIITWHIPISFLATMAIMALIFQQVDPDKYAGPIFHLITGGAIIGAFFIDDTNRRIII